MAMPPASKVSRAAMFSAQMIGTVSIVLKSAKLKFTGEKLTVAMAGLPTMNCHQGTTQETAIKTMLRIPAANAR